MLIKYTSISHLMINSKEIEDHKLKESESESKRERIGDGDFSRFYGHERLQFWQKFSGQGSSNSLTSKFNKNRVPKPNPQGGGCNGSSIPISQRCGKSHSRK